MSKTIGILSLKGGVGKTSSAIALGDAISGFGKKVLIVDGNFSAPNVGAHLNVINPRVTLHDVLSRKANVKDAIYGLDNFDIMPSSVFHSTRPNFLELKDKIKPLRKIYDSIVIDSSPALNEETLSVMLASDQILVVTTPDVPSLSTTMKAVKLARQRDAPIIGIIINKANNKSFDLSIKDVEETVGVPVLAVIPYEAGFQKSLSKFSPHTSSSPNSKASKEFRKLAGVLIGEKYKPFDLRNVLGLPPKRDEINREIFYDRVFG